MLEYVKTILKKVSFDLVLFEKELLKAMDTLLSKEIKVLKRWCYRSFGKSYRPILDRCFVMAT